MLTREIGSEHVHTRKTSTHRRNFIAPITRLWLIPFPSPVITYRLQWSHGGTQCESPRENAAGRESKRTHANRDLTFVTPPSHALTGK
jgi:hypothetical protein